MTAPPSSHPANNPGIQKEKEKEKPEPLSKPNRAALLNVEMWKTLTSTGPLRIPNNSMSIADFRHCKRSYWRFRKEFPPAGYCCDLHAELGPAKKPSAPKPPKPDAALFDLRAHRITIHRDRFYLQWYKCDECDRLEAVYSEAMAYWIDHPATKAIEEATAEAVKL